MFVSAISQYVVPPACTSQFVLQELAGAMGERLAGKFKGQRIEVEVSLLLASIVAHIVDNRDYHLADPERYCAVPREKLIVLLKEATSAVTLDIEIEAETVSRKVIMVDSSLTVNEFIMNPTDEKIKPLFRDLLPLEGAFWLYVSVRDKVQDVPLLQDSR